MKQLENEKSQIENSLNMISTQNQEEEINYNKLINEINIINEDVKQIEERKKNFSDKYYYIQNNHRLVWDPLIV